MSIKIEFLGPIGKSPIEIEATTLSQVKEVLAQDSSLSSWLESSAVAINDEIINSIDIDLKDGDRVSLLPPVCGG